MNRPSSLEDRLDAFLEEGPSTGPVDLLATAHARARSVRQRPAWWLALKGDTMETTWRARPLAPRGIALVVLSLLIAIAVAAAGFAVGSQLMTTHTDRAVTLAVPMGPEQLLAFASYTSDQESGDVFIVRADGTGMRRLTADPAFDTSPVWAPDGSRIAFYSGSDGRIQLRVAEADGSVRVLADRPGCMHGTNAPAWSPDGRFILYQVDPRPTDDSCEAAEMDIHVVPAAGGDSHRLLAPDQTVFTSSPDWHGDRIVMRGVANGAAQLLVATVTDPEHPWDLTAVRIDSGFPDVASFGFSRWSPDGALVATTYIPGGTGFGTAVVTPADGGVTTALLADPTKDVIVPAWTPDGGRLTLLQIKELLADHATYELLVVGADRSDPRLILADDLSGNGGPAFVSPDGTLTAVRAEIDDSATPGDVLLVDLVGDAPPITIEARGWSSVDWQPLDNPRNPATGAPEGMPEL